MIVSWYDTSNKSTDRMWCFETSYVLGDFVFHALCRRHIIRSLISSSHVCAEVEKLLTRKHRGQKSGPHCPGLLFDAHLVEWFAQSTD